MANDNKQAEVKFENITLTTQPEVLCVEPIPTIFADGFQGIAQTGGTVRINLAEDKLNPVTQKVSRHIVMRLVMPVEHFNIFAEVAVKMRQQSNSGDKDK